MWCHMLYQMISRVLVYSCSMRITYKTLLHFFVILSTQNLRFHYPASQYHWETYPCKGSIKDELAKINGGHQLLQTRTSNDPIIFVRYVSILRFLCLCAAMISSNSNALATKYLLITGALTFLSVLRLAIFYSRMMILRFIWLSTFRLYLLHYSSESILRLPPWQLSSHQLTSTRIWTPRSPMKRLVHWPMSRAIPILPNSG